ncbi:contractile injection system tape measure protein [Mycetohabitans endofungorum]|uniref:contractile injection system tape measure protein n=1 Tax=Mycetohabitans endofungorum TaxID=417203 RepID=UPI002B05E65E|nr:contractile injection system tape measure protein [Mycetohabitans endofungorum]
MGIFAINSICIVLCMRSVQQSETILQRCRTLFHQYLRNDLAQVVSRSPNALSVSIDRLTLDVGTLSYTHWETELRQRLITQLMRRLREAGAFTPCGYPEIKQRLPAAQAGSAAREVSDQQALDHQILDALRTQTVSDRAWLARLCLNPGVVKRLQQSFDSDTLQRIMHALNGNERFPALSNVLEGNTPQTHCSTSALTRERFTEVLLHSAESFFQHHPEQRLPRRQAGGTAREANDKQAFDQRVLNALRIRTLSDRAWLARLCLNPGMVKRLQQTLDSDTLQRIAHTLNDDECPPALNDAPGLNPSQSHRSTTAWTRERVTEVLLHSAESFFQRYPEQRSAAPMDTWPMGNRKTALLSRPGPLTAQQPLPASEPDLSIDKPLPISGVGVVLLWPLLPTVLRRLGLVTEKTFIDEAAQCGAVTWLDRLVWGDDAVLESRALFNKALCALPLDAPFPEAPLETERLAELNAWLDGLPMSLPGLQRCGVPDIRQLFLQRTGYLTQRAGQWTVHVDTDASDILLRDICWPMQAVLLPWLEKPIVIDWALTDSAYR